VAARAVKEARIRKNLMRAIRESEAREAAASPNISTDLLKVLLANKDGLLCVAVGGEIIYQRPGALKP
jgi:hypothetical protein